MSAFNYTARARKAAARALGYAEEAARTGRLAAACADPEVAAAWERRAQECEAFVKLEARAAFGWAARRQAVQR